MKITIIKHTAILTVCFLLGYLSASYLNPKFLSHPNSTISIKETSPSTTKNNPPKPNYLVDIPAKYFDPDRSYEMTNGEGKIEYLLLGNNLEVVGPPIPIPLPKNIEVINEEFKYQKLDVTKLPILSDKEADIDNDGNIENNLMYDSRTFDVDGDGKKEKFLYGSIAMNHRPQKVIVIKDGNIIFKSEYLMEIGLYESESNNGFYIGHTIDAGTFPYSGGRIITRYIYDKGKFVPVWYKEVNDLQTTIP